MIKKVYLLALLILVFFTVSCDEDDDSKKEPLNPNTTERASIDRFSSNSGTLMVRTSTNGLPEAGEPINYDSGEPFITQGLSPTGSVVQYYNFDVQTTKPAPIFLFFDSNGNRIEEQLNVVNVIPGDAGYNDFWQVNRVTVPDDYEPNTITSLSDIISSGFSVEATTTIVNCPIVPEGSIASKRLGTESNELNRGWYKDKVIFYFSFFEKILQATNDDMTPISPIFVSFNVNPDDNNPNSGPASVFIYTLHYGW